LYETLFLFAFLVHLLRASNLRGNAVEITSASRRHNTATTHTRTHINLN
jgi:hypothetical protein